MPLVPDPKNCDISVKRAIQGLSNKLGYTGHVTHASLTLSHTGIGDQLTLSKVCTIAAGLNVLRVTGLQTDGVAMTGTLRGAYIDVSNGSTAATGTIRAMELKARTEAPGDTGNDVNVLEGLSISADSKAHSVTTMRAAEFILDGKTAGTIDEAVGLRIANNLQVDKATVSYGLQIYCDSFAYTADIQLSNGAMIGISTSGADLKLTSGGNIGIGLPDGVEPYERLSLGSTAGTEELSFHHTGTNAAFRTTTGRFQFRTKSTVDRNTALCVYGNSTPGIGYLQMFDQDEAEYLELRCSLGHGYIKTVGVAPGPVHLQDSAHSSVRLFANAAEGETQELLIYGHKTGDASRRILEIGVGVDADDTASFDGVSNYLFDGTGIFTGLTITGNSVFGLNSSVFQPTTDSTTFFQVLDADGGTPIFNVDTTNERVGIGTTAPNAPLEVKGAKPGVVGGFQSGQLQVTGTGGEFYCAVITGHNSFNGNTQLWYLGNTSSSSHNDIAFINRQNAPIHFYTNNTSRMTIDAAGGISCAGTFESTGVATFTAGIELGHATDTTITRASAGNLNIEGNLIYRAGGTDVPIGDGGTGQSTAQLAINALSAVSGATNEHVLTKDTATGNATFKAAAGGAAGFSSNCRVGLTNNQVIAHNTVTKLNLDDEDFDGDGEWDSVNHKFVVTTTGKYLLVTNVAIGVISSGIVVAGYIFVNNVEVSTNFRVQTAVDDGNSGIVYWNDVLELTAEDEVDLRCYHNSGANRNALAFDPNKYMWFAIHRLS